MTLPVIYASGTVSVANGDTTVTGTNTLWGDDAVMAGDLFCDPAQPLVPPQRVASVTDDGELELWAPWPGTSMVDDAYEVRFVGIIERSTAQTRRLLEQLSVVRANGQGRFFRFSDTTADADPGPGFIRLNNADPSLATAAYIDVLDANGASLAGEIDSWDNSSSLIKGKLWLSSITSASTFRAYSLTGSVVDGTGYRKLTLTHVGGSGSFAADGELMVAFTKTGDAGDSFSYDTTVADPSELAALETEPAGYLVFVSDLGTDFGAFSGRSGVVRLIAGPDWELMAMYTGTKGDQGDQGDKGWSPRLVAVADGARRVWKLESYVGGQGAAPTTNVGDYAKADGTWTANIAEAADFRGPPGLNGAGTVASVAQGVGIAVNSADPTAPIVSLASALGQCRLVKDGANIRLNPLDGNLLKVAGALCTIPDAGVALAPTGLAPSTNHYVYAVATAGVITSLEASTTAPVISTTAGNRGTMVKTGDESRTLVGLVRVAAGPAFVDSASQRLVLSYFNRRRREVSKAITGSDVTITNTVATYVTGMTVEFLTWGGAEAFSFNGTVFHNVGGAGNYVYAQAALDAVLLADAGAVGEVVGPGSYSPMSFDISREFSLGYRTIDIYGRASAGTVGFSAASSFRCSIRGVVWG